MTLGWGPVAWDVAVGADRPDPPELAGVIAAAERFDDAAVPADLGPARRSPSEAGARPSCGR